jgi:hypothetical protein
MRANNSIYKKANKTDIHEIPYILLKVALNTINLTLQKTISNLLLRFARLVGALSIIHTKGILRRLLAKFRSRMNTIKCDNSKTNGLHRRILTIYSWTIFYITTLMCVKWKYAVTFENIFRAPLKKTNTTVCMINAW